jgi:hypothetical protein
VFIAFVQNAPRSRSLSGERVLDLIALGDDQFRFQQRLA